MEEDENEDIVVNDEEPEDFDRLRELGWTDELLTQHGVTPESAEAEEVDNVEDAPAPTAEVDPELKSYADFGRQWMESFKRDPVQAALAVANSEAFTPEMKAALINNLSTTIPKDQGGRAFDVSSYEPQSDLEEALVPNYDWIKNGETLVSQALATRDEDIKITYAYATALEQKLAAIEALLDTKLPDFEAAKAFEVFNQNPAIDLNTAVSQTYGRQLQEFIALEKQKRKERPKTVRNQGVAVAGTQKVESMMDAWKLAGAMLGQE